MYECRVTKAPIIPTVSDNVHDDPEVLKNISARSVPVETYNNSVLESEGLAEDTTAEEVITNTSIANKEASVNDINVVYITSSPGFVQSGRKAQDMYQEFQEMLQMFGPGEAEYQCDQLDTSGLTEGIITDDSDIWLFGGTKVYKNFFDQEKYVEYYSNTDLVQHFGLTRNTQVDKNKFADHGGGDSPLIQNGRFRVGLNQNMPFSGSFLHILLKLFQIWQLFVKLLLFLYTCAGTSWCAWP